MTGRPSHAVELAVRLVRERCSTIAAAARMLGCSPSSVRRALRIAGEPPRKAGRPKKLQQG